MSGVNYLAYPGRRVVWARFAFCVPKRGDTPRLARRVISTAAGLVGGVKKTGEENVS